MCYLSCVNKCLNESFKLCFLLYVYFQNVCDLFIFLELDVCVCVYLAGSDVPLLTHILRSKCISMSKQVYDVTA